YAASLFGSYNLIPAPKAKIFADLLRISITDQSLLIRPEFFRFVENVDNALAGKVKSVQYFGSYFEVEVQLNDLTIIVKTLGFRGKKGDKVLVSVAAEDVWYV